MSDSAFHPSGSENNTWRGLRESARQRVTVREYAKPPTSPSQITDVLALARLDPTDPEVACEWIPGVEIFRREVATQRFRGSFSELARQTADPCARLGFWPAQWAVTSMFPGTAKGFHIHPPCIPEGENPEEFFRRLYRDPGASLQTRPFDREQWDMMFFVAGSAEMILVDERAGLERRILRFFVEAGMNGQGESVGLIIPPGVAHAMRVEGPENLILVYGTSTVFDPASEGRFGSEIEFAELPSEWREYLGRKF